MLFGEYGVLRGGRAAVVGLPSHRFEVAFEFSHSEHPQVKFSSEFLKNTIVLDGNEIEHLLWEGGDNELRNLACYLHGFRDALQGFALHARVRRSFEPELGFGTSSALLTAFQWALCQWSSAAGDPERLYAALQLLQGRGSGYDVAVQTWCVEHSEPKSAPVLLSFENKAKDKSGDTALSFMPRVEPVAVQSSELRGLGCFVSTGVHSETRKVLNEESRHARSPAFYDFQKSWAESFLREPTIAVAREQCRESSRLALELGLLPHLAPLRLFTRKCDEAGVAWKTMGAGYGDCLWVVAPRAEVENLLAATGAPDMSVRFAFEDYP